MDEQTPEVPETPVEAPIEPEEQTPEPAQEAGPQPPEVDNLEVFKTGYDKLVEVTGYCIEFTPAFILRDDGTYSMVINTAISPKK